ncbi:hypothetical protein MTO96_036055, partial [Rhipicephalus appendiculatus]
MLGKSHVIPYLRDSLCDERERNAWTLGSFGAAFTIRTSRKKENRSQINLPHANMRICLEGADVSRQRRESRRTPSKDFPAYTLCEGRKLKMAAKTADSVNFLNSHWVREALIPTDAEKIGKVIEPQAVRCFWGKCSVIQGPWKKCVPNEQCDGSELRCERQCILEHTGCPQKHKPGSCRKDLFAWKCSTQYTCPQRKALWPLPENLPAARCPNV